MNMKKLMIMGMLVIAFQVLDASDAAAGGAGSASGIDFKVFPEAIKLLPGTTDAFVLVTQADVGGLNTLTDSDGIIQITAVHAALNAAFKRSKHSFVGAADISRVVGDHNQAMIKKYDYEALGKMPVSIADLCVWAAAGKLK